MTKLPIHSLLWRDEEVAGFFSSDAELAGIIRYEAALAGAQSSAGIISGEAALAVAGACAAFKPDIADLLRGIERDGMAIPELIRQLRNTIPEQFRDVLHLRSTSQDVIDTALILAVAKALKVLETRLTGIISQLHQLRLSSGKTAQMARTRMQRALPITLGDRITAWQAPLQRHLQRVEELKPRLLVIQIGGPVGIDDAPWSRALAETLGLGVPDRSWHTARDGLAELGGWLSLVTGSLGKLGQDIAMMAQNEIGEVTIEGGGKSSAMHHKSNPVAAELLVALARHNATMVAGLHQALVHEQERSGAAWALEWMILPTMFETAAAALSHCTRLLAKARFT